MNKITIKQTVKRTENYTPKGCRKPRVRLVDEEVSFSISHIEPSEAPVAFILHGFERMSREVRTYKGQFYVQDTTRDYEAGTMSPVIFSPGMLKSRYYETYILTTEEESTQRSILARKMVIGNEVFSKCAQPFYSYCTFGIKDSWCFDIELKDKDYQDYEFEGISPDDTAALQEAFDYLNPIWCGGDYKKKSLDEALEFCRIEVVMPECCTHKFQPIGYEGNKWKDLQLEDQLQADILKFMERTKKKYSQHFRYLSNSDFASKFRHATGFASTEMATRIG